MASRFRLSIGIMLLVFLLVPGLMHYVKQHEKMRLALANDARTIAKLESAVSQNAQSAKSINLHKFCIASNI